MLDMDRIPCHVAIIMDGNGRWAEKRGLPRVAGHNAGMQAMKEIVKRSSMLGVKHLTVYAFSTENWKRSAEEIGGIFKLLIVYVARELAEIKENNVKINILGDYSMLPSEAVSAVDKAVRETAGNTGMQFNIALNYGSRAEITRAVQAVCAQVASGSLKPEEVSENDIEAQLYTAGIPDPDVVIRTSGEIRLSNFLLWQLAYSEFVFTDVYWPDFTPEEYEKCLEEYQSRDRRFGGRK